MRLVGQVFPTPVPMPSATVPEAVRYLAGLCDGAQSEDGQGFSSYDAGEGRRLADLPTDQWTNADHVEGKRMLKKYQRQLLLGGIRWEKLTIPSRLVTRKSSNGQSSNLPEADNSQQSLDKTQQATVSVVSSASHLAAKPRNVPSLASVTLPDWFGGWRQYQEEAVSRVVEEFGKGVQTVIVDAPTGAGKSILAESVRQVLRAGKTTYLCTTRDLQEQVQRDFRYAKIIWGREHYPTLDRPDRFTAKFNRVTASDCTKRAVGVDEEGRDVYECGFCTPWFHCPYEVAKREALKAPLSVANISYFLTECNGPGKFRSRDLVIIDEAHLLESALMSYIEVVISDSKIKQYNLGRPERITKPEAWQKWIRKVYAKLKIALDRLPSGSADLSLNKEVKWLSRMVEQIKNIDVMEGWVYDTDYLGSAIFRPVDVSPFAHSLLWSTAPQFLLMSATIIPEVVAQSTAIKDYSTVIVPSTFPKANRPIIVRSTSDMGRRTTLDSGKKNWSDVAEEVNRIMDRFPTERILVHTVSYKLTEFLADQLASSRVLWYKSSRDRRKTLEEFKQTPGSVIIAPSLVVGIDLPDDLARVAVVAKVPYPNLGDKQIAAKLYSTKGGKTWYAAQSVNALIQSCGRIVRSRDDWGISFILDSAFLRLLREHRALFPSWFLEAVVMNTRDVEKAINVLVGSQDGRE